MAGDKFIMIGLDDERSKDIAEVLSNKTCKKLIDYLAETKEASEKDISDALKIPINTVEYNLNKLVKTSLIEKSRNFFWSRKGRKIDMYRLSNKKILISPRTFLKGIVPALISVVLVSFGIKVWSDRISYDSSLDVSRDSLTIESSSLAASEKINAAEQSGLNYFQNANAEIWAWFLLGGLFAILIFLLWNQYKKMKGGF